MRDYNTTTHPNRDMDAWERAAENMPDFNEAEWLDWCRRTQGINYLQEARP